MVLNEAVRRSDTVALLRECSRCQNDMFCDPAESHQTSAVTAVTKPINLCAHMLASTLACCCSALLVAAALHKAVSIDDTLMHLQLPLFTRGSDGFTTKRERLSIGTKVACIQKPEAATA